MSKQVRSWGWLYWQGLLKTSVTSLWNNLLRSGLAILGMIIGIAAIVIIRSLGSGLTSQVTGLLGDFGANVIYIFPGSISDGFGAAGSSVPLTYDDYLFLKSTNIGSIEELVPNAQLSVPAKNKSGESHSTFAQAVSANYFQTINTPLQVGRYFTVEEERSGYRYAVLGSTVAEKLYNSAEDALGQEIIVKDTSYLIVGVAKELSGGGLSGANDAVYIPYEAARGGLLPNNELITIYAKVNQESIEYSKNIIRSLLRTHKGTTIDDQGFSVITQDEILSSTNQILGVLTGGLSAIAAISLVVGGIGIMNIMLVSVVERTREIGVRRALGATKFDILWQFLLEAIILTGIGGIAGSLAGFGLATLVGSFIDITISLSLVDTTVITLISATIGVVFGIFPAWRAARLDPVEALRYE